MSKNMYLIYISSSNSLYFTIYQYIKWNIRFLQGNGYFGEFLKFLSWD